MTIRALAVVLIITFLFSTLFFVLLWKNSPSNLEQKLWMELAKALLQLAVIVVLLLRYSKRRKGVVKIYDDATKFAKII